MSLLYEKLANVLFVCMNVNFKFVCVSCLCIHHRFVCMCVRYAFGCRMTVLEWSGSWQSHHRKTTVMYQVVMFHSRAVGTIIMNFTVFYSIS